jgi:hypothetical protein
MKRGEPTGKGTAQPNMPTRNVAGAGEPPRFVGLPCSETGCACEGWSDDPGTGVCGSVNRSTGEKCGHPVGWHH